MKVLVPYLFLEKRATSTSFAYILHVLIHYPEDKHIIKVPGTPRLNLTDNCFERNVYIFEYKIMDGDIDPRLTDPLIPNFYSDEINLTTLLPTLEEGGQSLGLSLQKGDKVVRAEGYLRDIESGGTLITTVRQHHVYEFLKDRVSVNLIDTEPNSGQEFSRSIGLMADFGRVIRTEPGPGEGGTGGKSRPGHPFI